MSSTTAAAYARAVHILLPLSVTAYCTAERDLALAIFALPLLIVGIRMTRPAMIGDVGATLPAWVVNTLLTVAIGFAIFRALGKPLDVASIALLVVLVMLVKFGDRRSPRDEPQLIALGSFLAVAAILTDPGFLVGIQVVVFFPLLILTVMRYQLYSGQSRSMPFMDAAAIQPASRSHLVGAVTAATVGCLVVALGVFVLIPRGIGEKYFGQWATPVSRSMTGFTDTVQLGRSGLISESPTVVMNVRFLSMGNDPIGNLGMSYYLRGAVLDRYEPQTGSWRRAREGWGTPFDLGANEAFPADGRLEPAIGQRISVRSAVAERMPLFSLWRPVQLVSNHPAKYSLDAAAMLWRRESGRTGVFEYTVWSSTSEVTPDDSTRVVNPNAPAVTERIRMRARELAAAAGVDVDQPERSWSDDDKIATMIRDSFASGFRYSFDQPNVGVGVDPIEHFLFESRTGHCEYFASAMVALCQSVGVRARIVTGYVANEFDDSDMSYTVREDDAHAWVEVQVGTGQRSEGRWRRFDPTPSADLQRIHDQEPGMVARVTQWFDNLEFLWNRSVVSFDQGAQTRLLGPSMSASWISWLGQRSPTARQQRGRIIPAVMTGVMVFCVVAGIGLTIEAIRQVRRRSSRAAERADAVGTTPAARESFSLYESMLALLKQHGHPKPDWRPPLDHAQGLRSDDRGLAQAARHVSGLFYAVRFGRVEPTPAQLEEAWSLLRAVTKQPRKDRTE